VIKIKLFTRERHSIIRIAGSALFIGFAIWVEKLFGGGAIGGNSAIFIGSAFAIGVIASFFFYYFVINTQRMINLLNPLSKLNLLSIRTFEQNLNQVDVLLTEINEKINDEPKINQKIDPGKYANDKDKMSQDKYTQVEKEDLLSLSDVRDYELNANDIWIMSNNLEVDIQNATIKQDVINNLKGEYSPYENHEKTNGRYCYIVPDTDKINDRIDKMINNWKEADVEYIAISNVRFIKLKEENWVQAHDVTIYNGDKMYEKSEQRYKKASIIEFLTLIDKSSSDKEDEYNYVCRRLKSISYKVFIEQVDEIISKDFDNYKSHLEFGCWNTKDKEFLIEALEQANKNGKTIYDLNNKEFKPNKINDIIAHLEKSDIDIGTDKNSKKLQEIKKIIEGYEQR